MSLIVSRRPPSRNHSNDAFWMSIRFGRSRTCLRREKVFRARGAAARVLVNGEEASLKNGSEGGKRRASAPPPRPSQLPPEPQGPTGGASTGLPLGLNGAM